ncbi:flagellar hook protein FlgE [Aestuariibius insulae]|uniref:flagellar hook protein FlgE n=1 Tax=Aestuariibius insulae TaxID=2058287 RepID=UPI00345E5A9E
MTISSSLNAGVAGLATNASRLSTISDNIANSSTYGYKRVTADFQSMVIESGTGAYSAGGVRTTTQRLIDERGSLVTTSNATDLAVRGRGLLPVTTEVAVGVDNGDTPLLLTTTGSFRTDSEGYLKTTDGLVLMGWPAEPDGTLPNFSRDTKVGLEPIQIAANQFAGEPTTRMTLGINLPATETDASASGDPEVLSIEYYDNLGTSENLALEFSPTIPATPPGGSSNEWTLTLRDSASGNAVVGQYTLAFDDSRSQGGTLQSVTPISGGGYNPATGEIDITVNGGPLSIDIGRIGEADGLTQLSDSFAPVSINKDGSPVGNMTSVEVDQNGFVYANFDNGITRTIYQIPLVDVPNVNGLLALDRQTYSPTQASGSIFLWDAGDGPTGDVVSFAREESTTDVASELTNLIQTQRAYSSNAKVIQTVDEMLQETTNIKR